MVRNQCPLFYLSIDCVLFKCLVLGNPISRSPVLANIIYHLPFVFYFSISLYIWWLYLVFFHLKIIISYRLYPCQRYHLLYFACSSSLQWLCVSSNAMGTFFAIIPILVTCLLHCLLANMYRSSSVNQIGVCVCVCVCVVFMYICHLLSMVTMTIDPFFVAIWPHTTINEQLRGGQKWLRQFNRCQYHNLLKFWISYWFAWISRLCVCVCIHSNTLMHTMKCLLAHSSLDRLYLDEFVLCAWVYKSVFRFFFISLLLLLYLPLCIDFWQFFSCFYCTLCCSPYIYTYILS